MLDQRFHFKLDPCAWSTNALGVCKFYTQSDDGLVQDWKPGPVFVNWPYSKSSIWTKKCYEESMRGLLVVGLGRYDVSTKWWNSWVKGKAWVEGVPYRLHFVGGDGAYNFPSVVIVWHGLF
jgi:hypothetical protein